MEISSDVLGRRRSISELINRFKRTLAELTEVAPTRDYVANNNGIHAAEKLRMSLANKGHQDRVILAFRDLSIDPTLDEMYLTLMALHKRHLLPAQRPIKSVHAVTSRSDRSAAESKLGTDTCRKCGKTGHWARECRSGSASTSRFDRSLSEQSGENGRQNQRRVGFKPEKSNKPSYPSLSNTKFRKKNKPRNNGRKPQGRSQYNCEEDSQSEESDSQSEDSQSEDSEGDTNGHSENSAFRRSTSTQTWEPPDDRRPRRGY